ncbi:ATP-dependent Clp protease adapter ClpS [Luteipulveratus mongoliensis]|uniref:ATP-dependent Clp protease adapter protein ClpS n=1 Tax=Luteipulveratus mongoliensis TaxID=571913 RepID=A0A0K1JHY9_9MICO|nr:ATP-dependent Clp protease adapter ClpS [Luteipulveratus mongoliensis]AKU16334.1 Clp protease ClpS [Luteipulveratus mongoliensis]
MSVAPPEQATPDVDTDTRTDVNVSEGLDRPWVTIVWNDPVNLMSYVSWVFQSYFGYSQEKAEKLMLAVHHEGRVVVSRGTREKMETDTEAMHGYSLWATFQKDE